MTEFWEGERAKYSVLRKGFDAGKLTLPFTLHVPYHAYLNVP